MKTETAEATVNVAFGRKLDKPLKFKYSWQAYENKDEIIAAKDEPSDAEVVKFRNDERQLAARNKEQAVQFEKNGIVKPTLEDPQEQLRVIYNALMASKKHTEEAARELASATIGVEWAK